MSLYIQERYKNNPMPNCYIVEDCSWISTEPLTASSDVIKKTLVEKYRNVQGVYALKLMKSVKKGNKNKIFLKFSYLYNKFRQYFKYIFAYTGIVFLLGLLIGFLLYAV